MAKLVFRSGPYAGKSVSLPSGKTIVLGRNRDIDLPLPDLKLSRRHCQISYIDGEALVKDLNSTNGTFLNGDRVIEATVLNAFDRLIVGDTEIEFHETERADEFVAPAGSHDSTSATRTQPEPAVQMPSTTQQPRLSALELAVREMLLPLPPEPPALQTGPAAVERPQVYFCDMCNSSIPVSDWQLGNAKDFDGKNYCKDCLSKGVVVGAPVPKTVTSPIPPGGGRTKSVDDILAGLNDEAIVVDTTLKRRGVAMAEQQVADSMSKFERETNQPAVKPLSERRAAVGAAPAAVKPAPLPPAKPPEPAPATPSAVEPLGDEFEEIG